MTSAESNIIYFLAIVKSSSFKMHIQHFNKRNSHRKCSQKISSWLLGIVYGLWRSPDLLKALRPPAYTFTANFIHVQNPCKRHVSLCSSISKPHIQPNSMLLRWHRCRIFAAAENPEFMAASGTYSIKIRHQLRWPRFVPLNSNGFQWKIGEF